MCTFTLLRLPDGSCSIGFNRDELDSRRAESAPTIHQHGHRRAAYPTDADHGGTWIGVSDAGIMMALLNRNEPGMPTGGASRGILIPALLACDTLDHVVERLPAACRSIMRGFRLMCCDRTSCVEAIGASGQVELIHHGHARTLVRSSSGLGDALVVGPRASLFAETVRDAPRDAAELAQRAFHEHAWPDRRSISVCMDRDGARTVSRSFIRLDAACVQFVHARRGADGSFLQHSQLELKVAGGW